MQAEKLKCEIVASGTEFAHSRCVCNPKGLQYGLGLRLWPSVSVALGQDEDQAVSFPWPFQATSETSQAGKEQQQQSLSLFTKTIAVSSHLAPEATLATLQPALHSAASVDSRT